MKPRSQLRALASTIALLLGSASLCRADPIVISAGFLEMTGETGSLELVGNRGFTLISNVDAFGGIFLPLGVCFLGCPPGSMIPLKAFWNGGDLPGTATLDGRVFDDVGGGSDDPPSPQAQVDFTGSVTMPPLVGNTAAASAPFSFSGSFRYPDPNDPFLPLLEELTGHGTATLFLRRSTEFPDQWAYTSARYEFEQTAPIPEPGTLFLLGGGLAAYGARAYRRRTSTPGSV
jgi:hypothetical protein